MLFTLPLILVGSLALQIYAGQLGGFAVIYEDCPQKLSILGSGFLEDIRVTNGCPYEQAGPRFVTIKESQIFPSRDQGDGENGVVFGADIPPDGNCGLLEGVAAKGQTYANCGRLTAIAYLCGHIPKHPFVINLDRDLDIIHRNIGADLGLANLPSDANRVISRPNGSASLNEGVSYPRNTQGGNQQGKTGDNHHPKSPAGHILLSIKVLSGLGLVLCGLCGFNHTLAQGGRLNVNATGQRVLFYCLIMLAGAYLIAANIHSHGAPRCKNYPSSASDYKADSECF